MGKFFNDTVKEFQGEKFTLRTLGKGQAQKLDSLGENEAVDFLLINSIIAWTYQEDNSGETAPITKENIDRINTETLKFLNDELILLNHWDLAPPEPIFKGNLKAENIPEITEKLTKSVGLNIEVIVKGEGNSKNFS